MAVSLLRRSTVIHAPDEYLSSLQSVRIGPTRRRILADCSQSAAERVADACKNDYKSLTYASTADVFGQNETPTLRSGSRNRPPRIGDGADHRGTIAGTLCCEGFG
ncbi:hypothetical protein [Arenimonas sp.]|uniref:hypothetical protein n=1 Tax=Arenimonas sp. TaxID=1872635 RepID=UPI002D1FAD91|nr:hypothetical protein [Arenimonas sp.]